MDSPARPRRRSPPPSSGGGRVVGEPASSNNMRWVNPSTIVQLIAILAISILVAIATILSQHVTLNNNNNANSNNLQSSKYPENTNHLSMMHHAKNKRIVNEINKLEQQLQVLNNAYTALSEEVKFFDDNDNEAWEEDTKLDKEKKKKAQQQQQQQQQHHEQHEQKKRKRTVVCTKEQCEKKFQILDPNGYFYVGDNFPTKGCFTKRDSVNDNDGNVYFGTGGSLEEMRSDPPENVNHVRIWCEEEEEDNKKNAASILVDDEKSSSNNQVIRGGVAIDGSAMNIKKYIKPNAIIHAKDRKPKKWWIPYNTDNLFPELHHLNNANDNGDDDDEVNDAQEEKEEGSIIPIDLSVNHLQRIKKAPGSPNKDSQKVLEEFLPVVSTKDIDFRWRSSARSKSRPEDIVKTTAYQITTRLAHDDPTSILWDSGKVKLLNGLPDVVHVNLSKLGSNNNGGEGGVGIGAIIEWSVKVWDTNDNPSTSS